MISTMIWVVQASFSRRPYAPSSVPSPAPMASQLKRLPATFLSAAAEAMLPLPSHIMCEILIRCPFQTVVALSGTCRALRLLASSDELWEPLWSAAFGGVATVRTIVHHGRITTPGNCASTSMAIQSIDDNLGKSIQKFGKGSQMGQCPKGKRKRDEIQELDFGSWRARFQIRCGCYQCMVLTRHDNMICLMQLAIKGCQHLRYVSSPRRGGCFVGEKLLSSTRLSQISPEDDE